MEQPLQQMDNTNSINEKQDENTAINIYPLIRHLFLAMCILFTVAIILFLIYQNGKSIYDKGI